TIISTQKLYNYFAYDDGTPERGYGLTKSGSLMAYRFKLNKSPDTLRAVSIYFNKTLSKTNLQYFYLTVWSDNSGKPGDTIYSRLNFVRYSDTLNKFVTYHLESPVQISGTFYVGTITTTDDNLNIGFDRYNNAQENLFYNTNGQWFTSAFTGAILMRPLVGKPIPLGIPKNNWQENQLLIYPNPCSSSTVHLSINPLGEAASSEKNFHITLKNVFGTTILSLPFSETLDVSSIAAGLYIVQLTDVRTGKQMTGKVIITH
ncbi:MAG: T9SS type A sorting domain-containing protein, partial [Bacteroidota bacterium]